MHLSLLSYLFQLCGISLIFVRVGRHRWNLLLEFGHSATEVGNLVGDVSHIWWCCERGSFTETFFGFVISTKSKAKRSSPDTVILSQKSLRRGSLSVCSASVSSKFRPSGTFPKCWEMRSSLNSSRPLRNSNADFSKRILWQRGGILILVGTKPTVMKILPIALIRCCGHRNTSCPGRKAFSAASLPMIVQSKYVSELKFPPNSKQV